ncbi:hypothetical protein BJ166DRAFT_498891 [Pestalotiopsis sp. NC0098]|nr:hypothetical protein BJ166DRAFT_498891 [Pestalotiopsis sp. NC0098]
MLAAWASLCQPLILILIPGPARPQPAAAAGYLPSCLVFGKSAAGLPCQSAIFSSYQSPLLQAAVCYGLIHNAHCFTFTGPGDQTDNLGGCGCLYGCSLHIDSRPPMLIKRCGSQAAGRKLSESLLPGPWSGTSPPHKSVLESWVLQMRTLALLAATLSRLLARSEVSVSA